MPTVPKALLEQVGLGEGNPSLLSNQPASQRPDASSVLMASSMMANAGKIGRGSGESLKAPKRQKGSKKGSLAV